jgi:hypothetical protein
MKGFSDIVPAYFTTKYLQRINVPCPDVKVIPFYDPEFKKLQRTMEYLTMENDHLRLLVSLA